MLETKSEVVCRVTSLNLIGLLSAVQYVGGADTHLSLAYRSCNHGLRPLKRCEELCPVVVSEHV
jgi:hypothetical protein